MGWDISWKDKVEIRKENLSFLMNAWKPTFKYFAIAILLIVIGAILVNIAEGTIKLDEIQKGHI